MNDHRAVPSSPPPRILCVDDEPAVVESLSLHLDRTFEVLTALSGAEALEILASEPPVAVVISDMRMPGMSGAELLARIRETWPDTVRLLLTGFADVEATMRAVNEGQIFRFLMKPSPPRQLLAAVEAAVRQYQLVRAERELLEHTLRGAVRALIDVLALADPVAFGRAKRLELVVREVARELAIPDPWKVEVATMMSQIGAVTLPSTVVDKLYYGFELDPDEMPMVARMPRIAARVLSEIPRLEEIEAIILALETSPSPDQPLATQVIQAVSELDTLEASGIDPLPAIDRLRRRGHAPRILEILTRLHTPVPVIREIRASELRIGMVLADDLRSRTGLLLVPRGYEVDAPLLERLGYIPTGTLMEPILVRAREGDPGATVDPARPEEAA